LIVPQRFEQEYKYLCFPHVLSQLVDMTTSFVARRPLDKYVTGPRDGDE
jgi:hypothetical protein